jgi:hypothetical protein
MKDPDTRPAGIPPRSSAQNGGSPSFFSPGEQAAITRIVHDFPEAVRALEAGLRAILERLVPSCQGHLHSEADVDYLLMGLADRIVGRTIRDESDALSTTAIDLMTRHLLAGMRDEFLRRVLAPGAIQQTGDQAG